MSDEFIAKNPEAAVQFLVALIRPWGFFATGPDRVMRLYYDDIQLDYEPAALLAVVGIDPNFRPRDDARLRSRSVLGGAEFD